MTPRPLVPRHGFSRRRTPPGLDPHVALWVSHDGLRVTSEVSDMALPGTDYEIGPTWFIAVSRAGVGRPSDADMTRVVEAFELPAFDEDNHYPGITRGVFCPVDERYRSACECKVTETVVVEPDGFVWTNPVDGPCRGCELTVRQRLIGMPTTPCPLHGAR